MEYITSLSYQEILGGIAILIGVYSYIPYILGMMRGSIKPHIFSRGIRAILTGIAFVAQLREGGGAGARIMGYTAFMNLVIAVYGLKFGLGYVTRIDRYALGGAIVAIIVRYLTQDPLRSVILITLIDSITFFPTFRKAWSLPHEEKALTYALSGLKFFISLFALSHFSLITALFPISLVTTNIIFIIYISLRRHQLKKKK